jgi:hypothetical protein
VVAERIYNRSMKINDAALDDLRLRLSDAQLKFNEVKELSEKAIDRLEIKEHTYKECYQSIDYFM